jgi:hypothetical protein
MTASANLLDLTHYVVKEPAALQLAVDAEVEGNRLGRQGHSLSPVVHQVRAHQDPSAAAR